MNAAADIFLVAGDPGKRGGGRDPLLASILARLGLTRPSVAYVGAASGDSRVFFMWIAALLKKAGAGPVRLAALASRRSDPAKALDLLRGSDLVFVSGGDVEAGMGVLEKSGAGECLQELHRSGKPFIGLSAGSIMLARRWVRWSDPANDGTAEDFPCLGLAPLVCDTHAEKEDWEELKMLLTLTRAPLGYGIPAGAALRVAMDGSLAALGRPVHRLAVKDGQAQRLADLPVS
ncbi:MAG TPA: Type 1 glutamine amidotransferase-like domain-containing protein [Acidobacteriota bacterium]